MKGLFQDAFYNMDRLWLLDLHWLDSIFSFNVSDLHFAESYI